MKKSNDIIRFATFCSLLLGLITATSNAAFKLPEGEDEELVLLGNWQPPQLHTNQGGRKNFIGGHISSSKLTLSIYPKPWTDPGTSITEGIFDSTFPPDPIVGVTEFILPNTGSGFGTGTGGIGAIQPHVPDHANVPAPGGLLLLMLAVPGRRRRR